MTQYKIAFYDIPTPAVKDFPTAVHSLKAETVGLAVLAAIGQGPKPKAVKVWACLKARGKDEWVECHVSPGFLEAMIHLG